MNLRDVTGPQQGSRIAVIGGSTLPDKWHIRVCHMAAALVVRAFQLTHECPSLREISDAH